MRNVRIFASITLTLDLLVIKQNTTFPTKRHELFQPIHHNQTKAIIKVTERQLESSEGTLLGTIILALDPPARVVDTTIRIEFSLSLPYDLEVRALHVESNVEQYIRIGQEDILPTVSEDFVLYSFITNLKHIPSQPLMITTSIITELSWCPSGSMRRLFVLCIAFPLLVKEHNTFSSHGVH